MSRSGRPHNRDTFSLIVRNIAFRTSDDDLFRLFDRYGKVLDIYRPCDYWTGDPRGFAFVRYNYEDEARDAVHALDERRVDGRRIMVQFAKYGPNAKTIQNGRITEDIPMPRGRIRRHNPRRRYQDDYRGRDFRRRSRSSRERSEQDRYRDSDHRRRSRTNSISPDYDRKRSRYSGPPSRRSPSQSRSPSPRTATAPSGKGTPSKPMDGHPPCSGGP